MLIKRYDLILFGATGFTGRLVAEYLVHQYGIGDRLNWAIAARNEEKLLEVRESLGADIPFLIADSHDAESLTALVKQGKVICSTVGPYALHGSLLVRCCLDQGTDYCDLTGEVPWIQRMIKVHHAAAHSEGRKIVHCCGFDSIPSDLGVYFLQQQAYVEYGSYCNQIRLRVKALKGGLSGGTYASLNNVLNEAGKDPGVAALMADQYSLNPPGQRVGNDQQDLMGVAFDDDFKAWIGPFVMAGINTRIVRRSHALAGFPYGEDFTYEEATLTGKGAMGKLKAQLMATLIRKMTDGKGGLLKKLADYLLPDPGEGPSSKQRARGFFKLALTGTLKNGQQVRATVTGDRDPGYGATAKMLGESAVCLALDRQQLPVATGVLTPAVAMGDVLLARLQQNAGLRFELVKQA